MGKKKIPEEGIYDARELGAGRMFVLGFQHMFAMFGATVLVPILTGLDVSTTLLFAGLGTLLFHLITGGIVPAFLGSSFAFLGGYATIAPMIDGQPNKEMLPYACFGVACAGLVYVILSALFKAFGAKKVMRFFPPIVTGPIIIAIGLNLSSSAINNCAQNWWIAMVAIVIIIAANIWGKGMIKIIPILLGVIGSYVVAVICDASVRETLVQNVSNAKWFALPIYKERDRLRPVHERQRRRPPAADLGHHHRPAVALPPWSSTSATSPRFPPPATATTLKTRACTEP